MEKNYSAHWFTSTKSKELKRFYNIWCGLKARCLYEGNERYHCYWWRWITVLEKRKKFEWFREDMYESYKKHVEEFWEKETTIDRINNDLWYNVDNCRWATYKEQANNTRNNVKYKWKSIAQWAEVVWVKECTIRYRLDYWISWEDALRVWRSPRRWIHPKSRPVAQIKDWKVIKEFHCMNEASRELWVSQSHLWHIVHWKRKSWKWYEFIFLDLENK